MQRVVVWLFLSLLVSLPMPVLGQISGPGVLQAEFVGSSPKLTDLAAQALASPLLLKAGENREIPNKDFEMPNIGQKSLQIPLKMGDGARQSADGTAGTTPAPSLSFEGTSDDDNAAILGIRIVPPDTEGDIGKKYFIQMNNLVFSIFDKDDGSLVLGPLSNNIFFSGTGDICELTNDGDPVVLWDHLAKRWVFTQFAVPIFDPTVPDSDGHQCFAVSKTKDPLGEYHLYRFRFLPSFGGVAVLNDYPKMGVWPDGWYYTTNDFECFLTGPTSCAFSFVNVSAVAFDKAAMLQGNPATALQFKVGPIGATDEIFIGVQPSHLEGKKPQNGTPNTFWQVFDSEQFTFSGSTGPDGILHWDFSADFGTPANSTFVSQGLIPMPEYESFGCDGGSGRNCVDQPSPGLVAEGNGVDTIDFRTMFRAQYRSFDAEDLADSDSDSDPDSDSDSDSDSDARVAAVVLSVTADADGVVNGALEAGVRWAEVRNSGSGWTLHQASTYAPDDGENRFMPSIAQNGKGEIAIGYTVSSATTFPAVRYTTRRLNDPLGEMTGGEVSCFEGTGSQIDSPGPNRPGGPGGRWGDYSSMSVDPQDDCTFWYTNEYYEDNSAFDFKTRICKFSSCDDDDDSDSDSD